MLHPCRNGDVGTDRPISVALRVVKSTRIFVADAECKVIGISASIISKKRTPGFRRIDDYTDVMPKQRAREVVEADRRPHLNDQRGDRKLTLGDSDGTAEVA